MDRVDHEEFRGGDESIEDWLDGLEAKMDAMDLRTEAKKIKWCKAKIGSTGLQILKGIEPIRDWDQARTELQRYFGDEDAVETAWRNLEYYHAGAKSLGEIAAEIDKFARRASGEEHTRQRLAVRAFIKAVPRRIGDRIRERKVTTLKKALEEAKYWQTVQEEGDRNRQLHPVDLEEEELTLPEIQQQLFQPRSGNTGAPWKRDFRSRDYGSRDYGSRDYGNRDYGNRDYGEERYRRTKELECWACKEKGHFARECTLWREFCRSMKERRQQEPRNQGSRGPQEQREGRQGREENKTYHLNW